MWLLSRQTFAMHTALVPQPYVALGQATAVCIRAYVVVQVNNRMLLQHLQQRLRQAVLLMLWSKLLRPLLKASHLYPPSWLLWGRVLGGALGKISGKDGGLSVGALMYEEGACVQVMLQRRL